MCITFIFISDNPDSRYKLIILNNRDESLDRPTLELDWRDGVLSGTDIQDPEKGTWLGINKLGTVGNLLSISQPVSTKRLTGVRSRGAITKDFLESTSSSSNFFPTLAEQSDMYNGFQFLGIERNEKNLYEMTSLTNMLVDSVKPRKWPPGTYVWGNSPPEKPFRKVVEGKKLFEKFVASLTEESGVEEVIGKLMEIATNDEKFFPDPQIALQTQRSPELCQYLCSIMEKFPLDLLRYGTRSHSIILVDRDDQVTFYEKRMAQPPQIGRATVWADKKVTFKLDPHSRNV